MAREVNASMPRQKKPAPITPPLSRLMTVAEIAGELRLSEKAVRNLIYRGQLNAFSLAGRRIRVTREDFEAFLARELRPA